MGRYDIWHINLQPQSRGFGIYMTNLKSVIDRFVGLARTVIQMFWQPVDAFISEVENLLFSYSRMHSCTD